MKEHVQKLPYEQSEIEPSMVEHPCAWCGPIPEGTSSGVCERHENIMKLKIVLGAILRKAIRGERLPVKIAA